MTLDRPVFTVLLRVFACALFFNAAVERAAAQPTRVSVTATASRTDVLPGDQLAIAVAFVHEAGWHVHTHNPVIPKSWGDFPAIPTRISADPVAGLRSGEPQWPPSTEIHLDLAGTGKAEPYAVYAGTAVAFVPMIVDPDAAPGSRTVRLHASFQVCNDRTCLREDTIELEVPLNVLPPGSPRGQPNTPALFLGLDQAIFAGVGAQAGSAPKPVTFRLFSWSFDISGSGWTFLVPMLLLAALGGFLLNLTPCVLPVIPIKIMGLSAVAGNRRRLLVLGLSSSLGTISFWLGIGIAIAKIASFKAINQLFQYPFFSLGVGAFIFVMGLGMFGLFTVRLPQAVYAVDADKGSVGGSFLFGIMTAVLSTPCTAPFMASAAAWAATQPQAVTLLVFGSIGVGMAIPYFLLAAFPAGIEKVPRTGPASELVKQVMGGLLLAVAVFFVGTGVDPLLREPIDPPIRWHWWIVAAIVGVTMAWMVFRTVAITRSTPRRLVFGFVGAAFAAVTFIIAGRVTDRGPIDWIAYTPERFAEARRSGKVVVVDFTAEWCLNCKALESGVLHTDEVVALMTSPGVVPIRVDLTGNNAPGQALLQDLRWVGIPLLAIWGPGSTKPLLFDTYTTDTVVGAITAARTEPTLSAVSPPPGGR